MEHISDKIIRMTVRGSDASYRRAKCFWRQATDEVIYGRSPDADWKQAWFTARDPFDPFDSCCEGRGQIGNSEFVVAPMETLS